MNDLRDQLLITQIRTAGQETCPPSVRSDLAQQARVGARRRRARTRVGLALTLTLLVAAGSATAVRNATRGHTDKSSVAAARRDTMIIDGVRMGFLPDGYQLSDSPSISTHDGVRVTQATFTIGGRGGPGLSPHAIVVVVWRAGVGDPIRDKPGDALIHTTNVKIGDLTTWASERQESVSIPATVGITGVEVPSDIVNQIADHLSDAQTR